MPRTRTGIYYLIHDLRAVWSGDIAPVLLHHGMGTNLHIWDEWVPIVAAHRPVLRLDMRGWGRSELPAEGHRWSMEELTADLWGVLDACGVGRLHLVGESFGGSVVLAAALQRQDRVASATVLNGSYKGAGIGELANWPAQFADGVAAWSDAMMRNRFLPGALSPEKEAWFAATQRQTHPHVAIGLGGVLDALDLSDDLAGLNVPLTLILPDSSPFVPIDHAAALKELAPEARIRVVPNAKHGLPFSHATTEAMDLRDRLAGMK